jgi:hypothetical protein
MVLLCGVQLVCLQTPDKLAVRMDQWQTFNSDEVKNKTRVVSGAR